MLARAKAAVAKRKVSSIVTIFFWCELCDSDLYFDTDHDEQKHAEGCSWSEGASNIQQQASADCASNRGDGWRLGCMLGEAASECRIRG